MPTGRVTVLTSSLKDDRIRTKDEEEGYDDSSS